MVKRRAPKRDPSLPFIDHIGYKSNGSMTSGSSITPHDSGTTERSSRAYDVEVPMKMKIQDLKNEISSLETNKQMTISEMRNDESEILSIHNKIELLQVQRQKLQKSRGEKEGQIAVYSSKVEKLISQKKHLEVALDIVGGRV
jgi:chromosome segregation ATPase